MSFAEKVYRIYNTTGFALASKHLEECLKEVWRDHSNDNHNKVVGAINRMVRYADEDARDETGARIQFDHTVDELEKQGYTNIADLEYRDFREYLDKDFNPYD